MKDFTLGIVAGLVVGVFATMFYVNAISSVQIMNQKVSGIEQYLNRQIQANQQQPQKATEVGQG